MTDSITNVAIKATHEEFNLYLAKKLKDMAYDYASITHVSDSICPYVMVNKNTFMVSRVADVSTILLRENPFIVDTTKDPNDKYILFLAILHMSKESKPSKGEWLAIDYKKAQYEKPNRGQDAIIEYDPVFIQKARGFNFSGEKTSEFYLSNNIDYARKATIEELCRAFGHTRPKADKKEEKPIFPHIGYTEYHPELDKRFLEMGKICKDGHTPEFKYIAWGNYRYWFCKHNSNQPYYKWEILDSLYGTNLVASAIETAKEKRLAGANEAYVKHLKKEIQHYAFPEPEPVYKTRDDKVLASLERMSHEETQTTDCFTDSLYLNPLQLEKIDFEQALKDKEREEVLKRVNSKRTLGHLLFIPNEIPDIKEPVYPKILNKKRLKI